jgi:hypothetical protein
MAGRSRLRELGGRERRDVLNKQDHLHKQRLSSSAKVFVRSAAGSIKHTSTAAAEQSAMPGNDLVIAVAALCFCLGLVAPPGPAQCASRDHFGVSVNFSRPFNILSDSKIVSFLSANPLLPVALDDMRFFRFSSDHQRLVRGLILPLLFDQRAVMIFARFHSYTDVCLDPALDKLIDSMDEASSFSYLFFVVASPSYPIYQALSNISSQSSFDEWLQFCFLLFSFFEGIRFCCIVYDSIVAFNDHGKRSGFSVTRHLVSSLQEKLLHRPARVALASTFSYYVLWKIAPTPFFLLLSNAQIFALPAWHLSEVYVSVKNSWNCVLKYGTSEEQLQQKMKEVVRLEVELEEQRTEIQRLHKGIQKLLIKRKKLETKIEEQKSHSEQCQQSISKLKQQLKNSDSDSALGRKLREDIRLKEEEKENCDKDISDLRSEVERNKKIQKSLEEQTEALNLRCEAQRKEAKQNEAHKEELLKILKTKAISIDSVTFERLLARGGFGDVYLAQFYGMNVAVKFSQAKNPVEASDALMMEASVSILQYALTLEHYLHFLVS